eukprot:6209371-Pleurochrysis_carterae.AAC.1
MSDTCNVTRFTKRCLAAAVEAVARAQIADEAWEKLIADCTNCASLHGGLRAASAQHRVVGHVCRTRCAS